jgi:hypothetical protein
LNDDLALLSSSQPPLALDRCICLDSILALLKITSGATTPAADNW